MDLQSEIKKSYKKEIYFGVFVVLLILGLNYSFLDKTFTNFLSGEAILDSNSKCLVEKVTDGDTIHACNKTIRMLGINTPEKKETYYLEAKEFNNKTLLGKEVRVVVGADKIDLYGRTLAYVFLENRNINEELILNGFATPYFPSTKDKYYDLFFKTFATCLESQSRLCKSSTDKCTNCIELENLDMKAQEVTFRNICDFSCDLTGWTVKDEGRKNFVFPEFSLASQKSVTIYASKEKDKFHFSQATVWTATGDTVYLRDENYNLVLVNRILE